MLVFHAGPHKTATTYLQENLGWARRTLAGHGWYYPRQGTGRHAGHHELAGALDDWLSPGSAGHGILKRLAGRERLVLSAEAAARWAPGRFHALADVLGRDRIDVVHALRDPVDLFQSHWAEQIKQGQTWSLADRMAQHFADPWSSGLLNPLPVLRALHEDPRIRLHVIPFEVLKARRLDIFTHFCAAVLGLQDIDPPVRAARNVGRSAHETEFLRLVTLVVASGETRRIPSDLRRRFDARFRSDERRGLGELIRLHGQPARRVVTFPAPLPFKTELAARLRPLLDGCWTLDPGADPIFGETPQSYVYYDALTLMQVPQIAEAVAAALDRLDPQALPPVSVLAERLARLPAAWMRTLR